VLSPWAYAEGRCDTRSVRRIRSTCCSARSSRGFLENIGEMERRGRRELLRRKGHCVRHKRVERLWRLEGLPARRRRPRNAKRTVGVDRDVQATRPDEVWSYDFLHDRTEHGQNLKLLTVLEKHTRECLEIRVEQRDG